MEILRHLIIHELRKTADSSEAHLLLSETAAPRDERANMLVGKLHHTFESKNDILQGFLSPPEDALFPGYFQHWVETGMRGEGFVQFTRDSMQALQLALQGVTGAKGGYLVFADYGEDEGRTLGIFLVRDTEGLIFRHESERDAFTLDDVTYLDTQRLAMACRIQLHRLQDGGRNVQLIKHAKSQATISEYFINWIGLERPESSRELTDTFMEVVEHLPLPMNEETGQPMSSHQFQKEALSFALKSPQQTLEVKDFEANFYGEGQHPVQEFLQNNELEMDQSFRVDNNALRRHYNYRATVNGLSISFNRDHLADGDIRIEGQRIIIDLPELVEKLEDQGLE